LRVEHPFWGFAPVLLEFGSGSCEVESETES